MSFPFSLSVSHSSRSSPAKIHLFDIDVPGKIRFQESETLSPGSAFSVFETRESLSATPLRDHVLNLTKYRPDWTRDLEVHVVVMGCKYVFVTAIQSGHSGQRITNECN